MDRGSGRNALVAYLTRLFPGNVEVLVVCPLMRDEPTAQNPKINYLFFGAQRSARAALLRFADRLVAGTRLGTDDIVSALA